MIRIRKVLSITELDELARLLKTGKFTDGRVSAGGAGQSIKSNLQLDPKDPNGPKANQLVHNALLRCEDFKACAYPHRVSGITFSRYMEGMKYGEHTDNPVNWDHGQVLRSDMSFTIFLSSPDEYEGGELVLRILGQEFAVKYELGDMAIYPSGLVHRVNEVTSGCRRAAIGWLQSLVPQQERREVLGAIWRVRNELLASAGRSDAFLQLDFAHSNLQRMWTEN
ncbi:MAG: Fe2+-dependent dioxygenase [Chromatiales bacterium]|nr:Fe2+-dependent dioxygenase [Chromatiales bacterium]